MQIGQIQIHEGGLSEITIKTIVLPTETVLAIMDLMAKGQQAMRRCLPEKPQGETPSEAGEAR